ncbi:hypothetical protein Tco_1573750 [Tanacetum coccineum]
MRDEGGDFESWVGGFQKLLECDKGECDFESCWSGIMLYWRAGKFDHAFEVFRQMGEHVRHGKTIIGLAWEMDFESFLDPTLALENRDTPEGLT